MLTPEDRRRAEDVFELLLTVAPAERAARLAQECGTEGELAAEVRLLLTHYEAAPPDFLQSPAADQAGRTEMQAIGPYVLQEALGEGGMGVVYRARQTAPVTRTVAVKILKPGLGSREIITRFEAERQTLARLEHPNIARIYDAGTTADGRPYFVMEYVPGVAITAYCDAHRLNPHQRIELFVELCQGVQYAHQQGIIHRDLKPMNILVAEQDGRPRPKIIDFGVAKAVQRDLTAATLFTRQGQLIGTPEYMSPEQAEAAPVDTRTDVYSLGAVLYELLVGVLPIDSATLREAGFAAMMRLIREQVPPRPSTRAGTRDESAVSAAHRRRVEPQVLARSLRGELDWIALKALAKEPDRRYGTVTELAADLQRYLADEPVLARPAGNGYILRKFVRRHRLGVGLALTAFVAVMLLAGGMTYQAGHIARERDRANHEAAVAGQVKDFLVDIFYESDPRETQGADLSAREILDRGAKRLGGIEDGAVRAELATTLGTVYQVLGLYTRSDSLFMAARELWRISKGPDHPETLLAISDVASMHKAIGRVAEAESLFVLALDGWRRAGLAEDRRALNTAVRLANTYRLQSRYAAAESLYLQTLRPLRRLGGGEDPDVLDLQDRLAFCYLVQRRYTEAAAISENVLRRRREAARPDSLRIFSAMGALGDAYIGLDRLDDAEDLLAAAVAGQRRILGPGHPRYLGRVEGLASLYLSRDEPQAAEPLFATVLAARRDIHGDDDPSVVIAMHNLAAAQSQTGQLEEAEELALAVLAVRRRTRGEDHFYTQSTRWLLATIMARQGNFQAALGQLQTAVDNGFAHPYVVAAESLELMKPLQGDPAYEAILATVRRRLAED